MLPYTRSTALEDCVVGGLEFPGVEGSTDARADPEELDAGRIFRSRVLVPVHVRATRGTPDGSTQVVLA